MRQGSVGPTRAVLAWSLESTDTECHCLKQPCQNASLSPVRNAWNGLPVMGGYRLGLTFTRAQFGRYDVPLCDAPL